MDIYNQNSLVFLQQHSFVWLEVDSLLLNKQSYNFSDSRKES